MGFNSGFKGLTGQSPQRAVVPMKEEEGGGGRGGGYEPGIHDMEAFRITCREGLQTTVNLEKVMATVIWDIRWIILVDFTLQLVTVTVILYQVVM